MYVYGRVTNEAFYYCKTFIFVGYLIWLVDQFYNWHKLYDYVHEVMEVVKLNGD